ncbi:hypothetical protein BGZ98_006338 [Dissophora globulifera]|nr:hypothetical protein BGZ98_006338 [Dissophora globulifera]
MEQSDETLARLLQEQEYASSSGAVSSQRGDTEAFLIPDDDNDDDGSDTKLNTSALNTDAEAPFKDLHGLFLAFNDQYFESKLSACEVRWSPRMTRCAGLCLYQERAQYCSIRLSEPLLKFRPESDYIHTLLHEMIHAYLFVTKAIQDHDGHGADFQYHMNRINDAAGTTITIYHTFHDEVRYYLTHVWKCNGPCQHREPYFGVVKRSMNRPPQPADKWFAEHQETCGGTYTKISEPEPTKKKTSKSQRDSKANAMDRPRGRTLLDDFFSVAKPAGGASGGDPSLPSIPSPREAAAAAALARFEENQRQKQGQEQERQQDDAGTLVAIASAANGSTRRRSPELDVRLVTNERHPSKKVKTEDVIYVDDDDHRDMRIKKDGAGVVETGAAAPAIGPNNKEQERLSTAATVLVMVPCPVCSLRVEESTINDHVDLCIWRASGDSD